MPLLSLLYKRVCQSSRLSQTASAIGQAINAGDVHVTDDNVDDHYEAGEGKVLTALHRRRECNRTIMRKRKEKALKETGKLRCEMTFAERYGDIGHDFIEAHHTRPVQDLQPGDKTKLPDPVLVCASCHRMIHRRRHWLWMDKLRATWRGCCYRSNSFHSGSRFANGLSTGGGTTSNTPSASRPPKIESTAIVARTIPITRLITLAPVLPMIL